MTCYRVRADRRRLPDFHAPAAVRRRALTRECAHTKPREHADRNQRDGHKQQADSVCLCPIQAGFMYYESTFCGTSRSCHEKGFVEQPVAMNDSQNPHSSVGDAKHNSIISEDQMAVLRSKKSILGYGRATFRHRLQSLRLSLKLNHKLRGVLNRIGGDPRPYFL